MREMPDKAFDLAIVDPPYGLKRLEKGAGWLEAYGDTGTWNHIKPTADYFDELFRVSRFQIIWGANNFQLPPSEYFVIWDKEQMYPNMARAEYAWTNVKKPCKFFTHRFGSENNRIHPTQKPVALYKWLLTNYAKPGQRILDTHLGSGSSRIAAYDLGFDFTGYELDKDYFNAQEERFARHIAQPQLFEIPRVDPIQEAMFAAA